MNDYQLLIQQLDAFIRKYYANKLLKGSLLFFASLIAYILLVSVGEYYLYFKPQLKLALVILLILLGGFALVFWIIIPLSKMLRLGKIISRAQAAQIIGQYFPEVSDQLYNVLQLKEQTNTADSKDLIEASIAQKSAKLAPVPFLKAVNLAENKRYLWFLLPVIAIVVIIAFWIPQLFKDAGNRLVNANKVYVKPAPFQFKLLNKNLQVVEGQSIQVLLEITGHQLPAQAFIVLDGNTIPMKNNGNNKYCYTIENITQKTSFRFTALDYFSDAYSVQPISKPQVLNVLVNVKYPAYLGKKDEQLQGVNDLSVPAGTIFEWNLKAKNVENVQLSIDKSAALNFGIKGDTYSQVYQFLKDQDYTISLKGLHNINGDEYKAHIQVVEDQSPTISADIHKDDINGQQILITGLAGDDYGIQSIAFHYDIFSKDGKKVSSKSIPLPIKGKLASPYSHYFDIATLGLQPGQKVEYYAEVWDNDAVHGSKSAKSQVLTWEFATGQKAQAQMAENSNQINQSMSSSAQKAEQIQNDVKNLQKDLLQSQSMNWNQQQKMEQISEQQQSLKDQVEKIEQRFAEQQKNAEQQNYSPEIQKKQEALKNQLDNIKNKELAEQLKKMQELLQQRNKDNAFQQLQQMEQMNKLFNMDMQRAQELMKKLEMQMKLEDMSKKIDDLSKKEKELQNKMDANNNDADKNQQLKEQQDALSKELAAIQKDGMEKVDSINKKLEQPSNLDSLKDLAKDAAEEMQQSSDNLQKNQKQAASKAQQNAQNSLQELSKAMKSKSEDMDTEQLDIDIKATRQLLTNLIRFSFDQENLMNTVKRTSTSNPYYLELTQQQHGLNKNVGMIKDSLFSLSKRVFQIAASINEYTASLESRSSKAINSLENRNVQDALVQQQYAMTEANNLALLLNELLSNLMSQQSASMQSSGSGKGMPMPSSGKGAGQSSGDMMKDIITGQQNMGQSPGQGKPGQSGAPGSQGQQGQQGQNGQQPGQGGGQGKNPGSNQGEGQSGQQSGDKGQGGSQGSNGAGGAGTGNGSESNSNAEQNAEELVKLAEQQAALRRQVEDLMNQLKSRGLNKNGMNQMLQDIEKQMDRNETDIINHKNQELVKQNSKQIMTRLLQADKAIREQEEDDKRQSNVGKDVARPMPPEMQKYFEQNKNLFWDMYKAAPASLAPFYKKMAEDYDSRVKARGH